ncbi:hypothetical protein THAOC_11346 [Thalassiosira oceanica]|uniref:Uncharacterized protein n=1 Tax=Thalassiosira oceanica TaxID=159749 RepID=K0T2S2_THAOC|nr:hypothetical protein THAOC_11346 [Thalassiosira oceanica]|eukprot:EJK67596.1 hypothetical protein THAOC_11346 [Thalassiosira oceanica]
MTEPRTRSVTTWVNVSECYVMLCYVMLCYVMLSLLSTKGIVGATTKQIKLISFPFFRARLCRPKALALSYNHAAGKAGHCERLVVAVDNCDLTRSKQILLRLIRMDGMVWCPSP